MTPALRYTSIASAVEGMLAPAGRGQRRNKVRDGCRISPEGSKTRGHTAARPRRGRRAGGAGWGGGRGTFEHVFDPPCHQLVGVFLGNLVLGGTREGQHGALHVPRLGPVHVLGSGELLGVLAAGTPRKAGESHGTSRSPGAKQKRDRLSPQQAEHTKLAPQPRRGLRRRRKREREPNIGASR
jgi:hypothetical protein